MLQPKKNFLSGKIYKISTLLDSHPYTQLEYFAKLDISLSFLYTAVIFCRILQPFCNELPISFLVKFF